MADKATKKTTKSNEEVKKERQEQAAKARAARGRAANKDRFRFIKQDKDDNGQPTKEDKVAPQAQVILDVIEASGKDGILREELVAALDGVLVTRQPINRIVTYYQKPLEDKGLIQVDKATPTQD